MTGQFNLLTAVFKTTSLQDRGTMSTDCSGEMFSAWCAGAALGVCASMLVPFAQFEAGRGQRGAVGPDHARIADSIVRLV